MLVRCWVYGTYGGQLHINVLHFSRSDATTAQYLLLGGLVKDFWCDTHRGNVDATMQWNRVHVKELSSGGNVEYDTSFVLTGALGPNTQYVPFVSALFKFDTGVSGRRGHGRSFQGGYGHTSTFISGHWNPSTQTRLDSVAFDLTNFWCTEGSFFKGWHLQVCARNETSEGLDVVTIVGSNIVTTMNTRKLFRGN